MKSRADPALSKIHPLGKSPLLGTENGRVIAESGAIIEYLLTTYDTDGKFRPTAEEESDGMDYVRSASFRLFASTSFAPIVSIYLMVEMLVAKAPFIARFLFYPSFLVMKKVMCEPEIEKSLQYVQEEGLAGGKRDFLMGSRMTAADFLLSWPLDICVQRGWVKLGEERWKVLGEWYGRMRDGKSWKMATEKGNGYDLVNF